MAALITSFESKINQYLKPSDEEGWKERTLSQAENLSGVPRERMASLAILMLSIYVLLGNFLPLFSHIICVIWPVKESLKILRLQQKPTDNILIYWILYATISIFDFSALPKVPIYYFVKTGLFLYIAANGIDKLKKWSEPALKFTESWVLVTPQVIEEAH